jgi:hypothetical protein
MFLTYMLISVAPFSFSGCSFLLFSDGVFASSLFVFASVLLFPAALAALCSNFFLV